VSDQPQRPEGEQPSSGQPSEQPPAGQPEQTPGPVGGEQPPAYGQPGAQPSYGQQQPGAQPGYGQQQPGQYPAYQGTQPGYPTEMSPADQRMWAMLAHLGALLFSFVAPLIVYLVQKDRGIYVREQSREALNFNITLVIAYVAVSVITVVTFGIGALLYLPLVALNIIFPIMAAVAANKGENYRYPISWRLIS